MNAAELLPVRAARYAGRRTRELAHYLRGKHILRRYRAHYRRARANYRASHPSVSLPPLAGVGVRVLHPERGDLAANYAPLIAKIAAQAAQTLETPAACRFVPPLSHPVAGSTSEIEAVRRGEVLAVQVRDPLSIDGLSELCEPLMRELERTVYGAFVLVDKVYVYRSVVSVQAPRASWLWHFDNHPPEVLKLLIYLTDVDATSAPFEYLRDRRGRAVVGGPIVPRFGHSRMREDQIARLVAQGCERCAVTGPRGTAILFDDNVLHRATLATRRHRDVLTFQVRPSLFRADSHVNRDWTGSFPHWAIQDDPWDLAPRANPGHA